MGPREGEEVTIEKTRITNHPITSLPAHTKKQNGASIAKKKATGPKIKHAKNIK